MPGSGEAEAQKLTPFLSDVKVAGIVRHRIHKLGLGNTERSRCDVTSMDGHLLKLTQLPHRRDGLGPCLSAMRRGEGALSGCPTL